MKKILIILVILIVLAAITGSGIYVWYNKQINIPASESASVAEIEIEPQENAKDIAIKLQTAGVIKNSDIFFFYLRFNKLTPQIQAGVFKIPKNLTVIQVAETIQKAGGQDIWITIPEGLRTDEIAQVLDEYFLKEDNTKFDKQEFTDVVNDPDKYELHSSILDTKPEDRSLEGYLFPDTYNIRKDITSMELIELLLETFDEKLQLEECDLDSYGELNAYEIITLASIIEREALTSEERYMISDILQKRLRGEMEGVKLLQADATLLYELKDWQAVVTKELKDKDSPYNTYKVTGLPVTPICNPGMDSIQAVVKPEQNEYFFYLHGEDREIHYAKTNTEHINNQRCYINKNPDYCP